jgi:hypothetical protein
MDSSALEFLFLGFQMDAQEKIYWTKAVAYIESGQTHPGHLLKQFFMQRQHINKLKLPMTTDAEA